MPILMSPIEERQVLPRFATVCFRNTSPQNARIYTDRIVHKPGTPEVTIHRELFCTLKEYP